MAADLFADPAADAILAKTLVVHERLCAAYGCPVPFFSDKVGSRPGARTASAL